MSEEDKTNVVSLQYWFRVIDLNGDGVITPAEMQYFYTEQMQRMADLNMEVVPFRDILAQMCVPCCFRLVVNTR
jgi:serine/threonine-protein phosphatase 2A regulatory subunit B''